MMAFCKTLAVHCKTIHFGSGIPIKNEPRRAVLRWGLGWRGVNRRKDKEKQVYRVGVGLFGWWGKKMPYKFTKRELNRSVFLLAYF